VCVAVRVAVCVAVSHFRSLHAGKMTSKTVCSVCCSASFSMLCSVSHVQLLHHGMGWIFVRVQLRRLSNRSFYQTFSVNPSFLYQAVGTQAKRRQTRTILSIRPFHLKNVFGQRLLASPRLTKKTDSLKTCGTSFGCLVNRAVLVQISKNMPRVS